MSRKDDLQNQIATLSRLLQKLREKKARQGDAAHPSLDIEIEDTEVKLEELQAELKELGEVRDPSASAAPLSPREQHYQIALHWAEGDCSVSLARFELSETDLRLVDLEGADLRLVNLNTADLRQANLQNVDLRMANLSKADLSGANLHGANLSEANFIMADLSEADLSEANLTEANLSEAKLRGQANLRGPDCLRPNYIGPTYVEPI